MINISEVIKKIDNCHIESITVLTGNDSYSVTDAVKFKTENDKLVMTTENCLLGSSSGLRLRGEPAVILNLLQENTGETIKVLIGHHKGNVYLDVEV